MKAANPVHDISFADLLRCRAAEFPRREVFSYYRPKETNQYWTYEDLDRRARAIGGVLAERKLRDCPVLLAYPHSLEYITAFFGCLYAGAIAVPMYAPKSNAPTDRFWAAAADCGASVGLSTQEIVERVTFRDGRKEGDGEQPIPLTWIATETVTEDAWAPPAGRSGSIAFLQYTSGSTGRPKGVIVSHANLLSNSAALRQSFRYDEESRSVSWLPLFHDMGLIGGILQPIYGNYPCLLLSPFEFLRHPALWLKLISRTHATISGGPNFAYELVCEKICAADCSELDLNTWQIAFNGAEPVKRDKVERFAARFAQYGFRAESMFACYGLAEATLLVSAGSVLPVDHLGSRSSAVSSGAVAEGCELRIVDPEAHTVCPDGVEGEIWLAGPNVARGYWNNPAGTDEAFGARLVKDGAQPFLRTGDLGFVFDSRLYVTGRKKDLVIIRGRNYHAEDLEWTAGQSRPELKLHRTVACAIPSRGTEALLVLQECERSLVGSSEEIFRSVREALFQAHEVRPEVLVLVPRGALPKTSSGKTRRSEARSAYLQGRLKVLAESIAPQQRPDGNKLSPHFEEGRAFPEEVLRSFIAGLLETVAEDISLDSPITGLALTRCS